MPTNEPEETEKTETNRRKVHDLSVVTLGIGLKIVAVQIFNALIKDSHIHTKITKRKTRK